MPPDLASVGESHPQTAAHPYPLRIANQTQELLRASIFHATFVDVATGAFVSLPDGMVRLEALFDEKGCAKASYEEGWELIGKYQPFFDRVPFQSVVLALNSHWQWYFRKLFDFIAFARAGNDATARAASSDGARLIDRRAALSPLVQLGLLQRAAGIELALDDSQRTDLHELALVRDLGIYHRWEVDAHYLESTHRRGVKVGELRVVTQDELHRWHALLGTLVDDSASKVAQTFNAAPKYP